MGRAKRASEGGLIYHVLNRANARLSIFEDEDDYAAFERILFQAVERTGTDLLAFCVMRNHWHLVVKPHEAGELSRFVGWLTLTHTQRWHAHRGNAGAGHLYQGRFKSFPVQEDDHFLTVCRYVERNALKANLVDRAEQWRWCSLWHWNEGGRVAKELLSPWPVRRSPNWLDYVNTPETQGELDAIRNCAKRGSPYGTDSWCDQMIKTLNLEITVNPRGRPKLNINGS
jgi:putative transposase